MLLLLSTPFANQTKSTSSDCKKTPPQSKGPFYKVPSKIFNNDAKLSSALGAEVDEGEEKFLSL